MGNDIYCPRYHRKQSYPWVTYFPEEDSIWSLETVLPNWSRDTHKDFNWEDPPPPNPDDDNAPGDGNTGQKHWRCFKLWTTEELQHGLLQATESTEKRLI